MALSLAPLVIGVTAGLALAIAIEFCRLRIPGINTLLMAAGVLVMACGALVLIALMGFS